MGRKIKDYPLETDITGGDYLLGSDEHGRTKNFPFETVISTAVNSLNSNLLPDWLLVAKDTGIEESFTRTSYDRYQSTTTFNYGVNGEIVIDSVLFNLLSVDDRIIVSNGLIRFISQVATKGTDYITLKDAIGIDDLNIFEGNIEGYSATNTIVAGYTDATTTFVGNIVAPNLHGLSPEDEAAIAGAAQVAGDNTFTGENIFSNSKGIQTARISESGGSGVASVSTYRYNSKSILYKYWFYSKCRRKSNTNI